ncbi:MAG TPA: phosphatidylserine decarboxylase family protein [Blastocatellia bacterium]|nr:phosphatidylserine decarboxylase family protein [Blastocatellia bacterium]
MLQSGVTKKADKKLLRIAREGIIYILVPAAVTVLLLLLGLWLAAIPFAIVTAFMAFFFRDPKREPPDDPRLVVAPADGRVTRVKQVQEGNQQSATVVSIFLSPLDVHINRAPIAGEITNVAYTRGKFLMATNQNASLVNEQNALTIRGEQITVVCKQIAGILARRIICWKHAGERVSLGERFGLIKFSSRTDVLLPPQVEVLVHEGARVRGGVTIIGRIR